MGRRPRHSRHSAPPSGEWLCAPWAWAGVGPARRPPGPLRSRGEGGATEGHGARTRHAPALARATKGRMPEQAKQQTQAASPPPPGAGLGRGFPDLGLSLRAGGDPMLKWLQQQAAGAGAGSPAPPDAPDPDPADTAIFATRLPGGEALSGGPLAALHAAAAARGLFAVSRVNPLFLDDGASPLPHPHPAPPTPPPPAAQGKRSARGGSGGGSSGCGGGKSGSSGYGGHSSSDGGCASSSGGEDDCAPHAPGGGAAAAATAAALAVLRRDAAFVSSIVIPSADRPGAGAAGAGLSPIPEGVAEGVPRPVWPRAASAASARGGDPAAEEALRRLSLTLSASHHLERMTRALGHSCSSSGQGSSHSGSSHGNGSSTSGSVRASPSSGSAASSRAGSLRGDGPGARPSPAGSSSGFSELTPPGSARRPPAGPLLPPLAPPLQLDASEAALPTSLRNAALIYGTLRRGKGYERVRAPVALGPPDPTHALVIPPPATAAATATAAAAADAKRDALYGLGARAPDFTLDVARAERLLRKIREAKQRRCACRLLTCALALVVFLAAVVAVSMLITRGQRVFGPL